MSSDAILIAKKNGVDLRNELVQYHSESHVNFYDVVCNFQVLEHVDDANEFLSCSLNTLKPGGMMIISVPNEDSFLKHVNNGILNMPPHHITRWPNKALYKIAELFKIERITLQLEPLAPIHRDWYAATLFTLGAGLCSNKLIDFSLKRKIINKLSAPFVHVIKKGLDYSHMISNGHSIVAVYRKSK